MSAHTAALPALVTVAEAAASLSCSPSTIRRMLAEGELEPVRLRPHVSGASVRIRASDLRRLVDEPRDEEEDG